METTTSIPMKLSTGALVHRATINFARTPFEAVVLARWRDSEFVVWNAYMRPNETEWTVETGSYFLFGAHGTTEDAAFAEALTEYNRRTRRT